MLRSPLAFSLVPFCRRRLAPPADVEQYKPFDFSYKAEVVGNPL